jgi:hypothetical protein
VRQPSACDFVETGDAVRRFGRWVYGGSAYRRFHGYIVFRSGPSWRIGGAKVAMLSHFAQISQERVEILEEQKATGNSEMAVITGVSAGRISNTNRTARCRDLTQDDSF